MLGGTIAHGRQPRCRCWCLRPPTRHGGRFAGGIFYHLHMSVDDVVRAVAESALSVDERLGFLELCEARSVDELLADRERVEAHRRTIEAAVEDGTALEGELANRLATALTALLANAAAWSFVERRVLAGAVEYFVQTEDDDSDFASDHGLEDDARVVAAVCEALGRPDLAGLVR